MKVSQGILTARGGMTSHAAVVARGMGTCCVSGCGALYIDEDNKKLMTVAGKWSRRATSSPSTASTGNVYLGASPPWKPRSPASSPASWPGPTSTAPPACAPTPTPPRRRPGRKFGAEGIGLCRTEHMFFAPDRIPAVREMICRHHRAAQEGAGQAPAHAARRL
jgi:pyruvate,orthophosphate dikinase